jgi:hypothetical protein
MREEAVITGNQLEVLVALVLGLDAVVIAGIVISRLTHRRANRQEAASSVALADAPYSMRPDGGAAAAEIAGPAATAPFAEAPPSVGEADYPAFEELAPPPVEPEIVDATVPAASSAPSPVGLDFGPTWVDPLEMAATAAAEWRHDLRRDLARAAHRGRSAMVMHLKLDIDSRPDLSIQEVARLEGLLLDTLNTLVRSGDHVDRTGPGRFHVILSEMPEAGAVAVAERIKDVFAGDAPDGPRLLIGWAAMETEADIALALQRAAERVYDGRGDVLESPLGP